MHKAEVIMTELILEQDDQLKTTVNIEEGRVCFREKEKRQNGWIEIHACWHEINHLERALSLAKKQCNNI
jgi:hypothetical protein